MRKCVPSQYRPAVSKALGAPSGGSANRRLRRRLTSCGDVKARSAGRSQESEHGGFISEGSFAVTLRLPMGLRIAALADHAVAFDRAPTADHHLSVFLFGHAGH